MRRKFENIFLMKSGTNNMLNSKHYVPILKWKRAEQGALEALADEYRDQISPLIELVMPKPKSLFKDKENTIRKTPEELYQELITTFRTKRISEIPEEIIKSWGAKPAYIDFSLLTFALKVESIKKIMKKAAESGAELIPVMNLSDNDEVKKAMQQILNKHTNAICLRIVSSELEDTSKLNNQLDGILQYFNMHRGNIDLLIDLKALKENGTHYRRYFNFSQEIKGLAKWRNFIFACGTFPENLSECPVDQSKLIPRVEWVKWLDIRKTGPKRIPTFADYTVRNPIYNETLQFYHSSASIKYTLESDWIILRGKAKKFEDYLAHSSLLVKDNRFCGENFSVGDKYIAEKAKYFPVYMNKKKEGKKLDGTGNTVMWLEAFINHHLTLTAYQIANLS